MRVGAQPALLLIFCAVAPLALFAQQEAHQATVAAKKAASKPLSARVLDSSYRTNPEPALLHAEDGLTIIGAALESRGHSKAKLDCSHLVQAIYERAGYPYAYVNSRDLYAGIEEFHRVARVQSGDLVVWPGHVGIVISPTQKTFFSSLTSGAGLETYDSPYWKKRGTARFYRYVSVRAPIYGEPGNRGLGQSAIPNLQRAALAAKDAITALPDETTPADFEQRASMRGPIRAPILEASKPKAEQITAALRSALEDSGTPGDADVFALTLPWIVVGELEARAVKIHGNQGEVTVRITSLLSLGGSEANFEKQQQIERWTLRRRDRKTWEVLFPEDALYVRRDVAVRALAHQLARLSDTEESSTGLRQKSQLAQMLNAILEPK